MLNETFFDEVRVVDNAPLLVNRTASRQGAKDYSEKVYRVKQENPRQRLVLELAAKGKTNKEIAQITGYAPETVGALLRQPATQQTLVNEIRRTADRVDEEVLEIIKIGCLKSAKRLLSIIESDNPPKSASAHISAANTFLERRYGKANQPINAGGCVDLNNLSDAELATRIARTSGTATQEGGLV